MGPQTQGPEALLGQHIAGYRLERVLGVGATGAVYLGQHLPDQPRLVEQVGGSPIAYQGRPSGSTISSWIGATPG